jgi:hypothetical protein
VSSSEDLLPIAELDIVRENKFTQTQEAEEGSDQDGHEQEVIMRRQEANQSKWSI